MNFGKATPKTFMKTRYGNRKEKDFFSVRESFADTVQNSVQLTESLWSKTVGPQDLTLREMFSERHSMQDNQGTQLQQIDSSLEVFDKFDYSDIKERLFTRDGGASLNDDGLPYLITQMKRDAKFQSNNT